MQLTKNERLLMGNNILLISYDSLIDPLGQSQILPYFKRLSKAGYQVTILSCEKKFPFDKNSSLIKRLCEENKINWEFVFYTKSPPVISTFADLKKMEKMAI